jgi:alpha-D-ribose 1-methylphosphonate 5-triphosphate diphosphatase
MTTELSNAQLVLPHGVETGSVCIGSDGRLALKGEGAADAVVDLEGDYLLPGLIDIHTDNLEHHLNPRPAVKWPSVLQAVLAHDWVMVGAGITTVLDALALGDYDSAGTRVKMLNAAIDGISAARAAGLTRADHYLHFRCELSDAGLLPIVERHKDNPALRLMSVMDHTPGQRQWHNIQLFRDFRRKKNAQVWSDEDFAVYLAERQENQRIHSGPGRARIGEVGRQRGVQIASHDDTTIADVEESHRDGITISEFPTTMEAARRARELGMKIVMGGPNVVLGGSHSGNVSALELAKAGLLDILTSDYVPASLLHAAFILAGHGTPLHEAVATVTATPAAVLGFDDRGRIADGLRADLVRVRLVDGQPVVRGIWVDGRKLV